MARKSSELKKRCWLAKQRLKMGYWESLKQDKSQSVAEDSLAATEGELTSVRQMRELSPAAEKMSVLDERLYRKVCEMLDSDEITLNPIGQLIEQDVYGKLDSMSKQRYVLELSNKFRELKERYYRERTGA